MTIFQLETTRDAMYQILRTFERFLSFLSIALRGIRALARADNQFQCDICAKAVTYGGAFSSRDQILADIAALIVIRSKLIN